MSDQRQALWAPWRIDWILSEKPEGCPLCTRGEGDDPLLVVREEHVLVVMNKYPYAPGHIMVCPARHITEPSEMTDEERGALYRALEHSMATLRKALSPEGLNVGMNLGHAAGAGVEGHFHWHVIPRWSGDTNVLSVLSDVRVINQHIRSTRDRIAECW